MKHCCKCGKPMYHSYHHLLCNDCWKAKKLIKSLNKGIPENKSGKPIYAVRKNVRYNK
jgi:hypothetical protein